MPPNAASSHGYIPAARQGRMRMHFATGDLWAQDTADTAVARLSFSSASGLRTARLGQAHSSCLKNPREETPVWVEGNPRLRFGLGLSALLW